MQDAHTGDRLLNFCSISAGPIVLGYPLNRVRWLLRFNRALPSPCLYHRNLQPIPRDLRRSQDALLSTLRGIGRAMLSMDSLIQMYQSRHGVPQRHKVLSAARCTSEWGLNSSNTLGLAGRWQACRSICVAAAMGYPGQVAVTPARTVVAEVSSMRSCLVRCRV